MKNRTLHHTDFEVAEQAINILCKLFKIDPEEVMRADRTQPLPVVRSIFCAYIYYTQHWGVVQIGNYLGMHHSSVIQAITRYRKRRFDQEEYHLAYRALKKEITSPWLGTQPKNYVPFDPMPIITNPPSES